MPRMTILNTLERVAFDSPPQFNSADRKKYFSFPMAIMTQATLLKTPTNQVCYLIMVGYFKATRKFFSRKFHPADIKYLAVKQGFSYEQIHLNSYAHHLYQYHRKTILDYFDYREFDEDARGTLAREINEMVRSQLRPRLMMGQILELLKRKKIEIPNYNMLANLVVSAINQHKRELTMSIESHLTRDTREMLDALLEKNPVTPQSEAPNVQRYQLTLLKKFNQSTKAGKVKANLQSLQLLRELFSNLSPMIQALNLTHEGFRYYATTVIKSRTLQILKKGTEDRYLHLITFIVHQYFKLQDTMIMTFLSSIQNALNSAYQDHKNVYYEERQIRKQMLKTMMECLEKNAVALSSIQAIIRLEDLPDEEKVKNITGILSVHTSDPEEETEQLSRFRKEVVTTTRESDFYTILETKSLTLQKRVAEIIKHVEFNNESSSVPLMTAIDYYRKKSGTLDKTSPVLHLLPEQRTAVFNENGGFKVSLYKALLLVHIADAIKAGTLNLKHSYKYLALDEYLISKPSWEQNKDEYLKRAELENLSDCQKVLGELEETLNEHYHRTNQNILRDKNEFIKFRKDGRFQLATPKVETEYPEARLADFFPRKKYISLMEVLATIENVTGFLNSFEHSKLKYRRERYSDRTFFAGIIGYGCNIGSTKIGKISRAINESELENAINWYFTEDNIHAANDRILALMDQLSLPEIYRRNKNSLHTSSDGQKFGVAVDSLNANYSFKYFGKGKGVTVYSFIDERHLLFHTTVISPAEREAAYVIDGLMNNDVVKSDIHSTDSDGLIDAVFGATYPLRIAYAPRLKNPGKRTLYAFEKRKVYQQNDYRILPTGYINLDLIEINWDDLLRFFATIKLKITTASQLFRRLNSYSKQHTLYRALKEFGKIHRSIYTLRYLDILELRQAVEKQLNKVESSNKFRNAVAFANNQEFLQGTKEEQDIAEGCRRLIKNAIICWNYLYLSKKITLETNEERRQELIDVIRCGSVVTWQHINLHGEYDFSDENLRDSVGLDLPKIMELKLF